MISSSRQVNRYDFINKKWVFFKKWMKKLNKCYFVKDIEIDEATKTFTFKKVYKIGIVKIESENTMEAIWEEEELEGEQMKITVYVRQVNEKTEVQS